MLPNDTTINVNSLFNELTAAFRVIGANNYKGSQYYDKTSEHEKTLLKAVFDWSKKHKNKIEYLKILNSLGNYFVEIRSSSFVFVEKEAGHRLIIQNP